MRAPLFVLALLGISCRREEPSKSARPVSSELAIASSTTTPSIAPPAPTVVAAPSVVLVHETLAPPPRPWAYEHEVAVWPSRVCTTAAGFVVESDCGCGETLACSVSITSTNIALEVHNDGTYGDCTDCFAMKPALCPIAGPIFRPTIPVLVHGARAFDVTPASDGRIAPGTCWTLDGR